MTEELVSFETAKLAKAKGFDEECMNFWEWYERWDAKLEKLIVEGPFALAKPIMDFRKVDFGLVEQAKKRPGLYNRIYQPERNRALQPWLYARPTQDLLERWLREVHNLYIEIGTFIIGDYWKTGYIFFRIERLNSNEEDDGDIQEQFETFERAREAALQHALKLIP